MEFIESITYTQWFLIGIIIGTANAMLAAKYGGRFATWIVRRFRK